MIDPEVAAAIDAITVALNADDAHWRLRPESDDDIAFVRSLYASTRWEELAALPWPDEAKRAFLSDQSRLQGKHYREHFTGAAFHLIERDARPVGRVYLHASLREFLLLDIALLPEWRGLGHGGRVLAALMQCARTSGRCITLHVENDNPARRLYARLGFAFVEQQGFHACLRWPAPDVDTQLNTAS